MTNATSRPRLNPKVRLRFDRRTGRDILLYPEMGLELNQTATEIVRLCTGEWTVADIARSLTGTYGTSSSIDIERDVRAFLETLASRGLLQGSP